MTSLEFESKTMAAPKRELFKAAEVCEMAQLQSYVLRSWEAEFPGLGQASTTGARVYRPADVELVLRIKQLVFVEGFTLAGARRRLEEDAAEHEPIALAAVRSEDPLGETARARLRELKKGLEGILVLLGGPEQEGPQLELVAPPGDSARPRAVPQSASVERDADAAGPKPAEKMTPGKRRRASA